MMVLGLRHFSVLAGVLGVLVLTGCQSGGTEMRPTPLAGPSATRSRAPSVSPGPAVRSGIPAGAWRQEANRWVGTPYRYGGMDRRGVDCSGFACEMYRRVAGILLPRTAAQQYQRGAPVARAALRAGDLVFFAERGRGVFHVGVSLGGDEFAHASSKYGVTMSRLSESYYARRYCGARRSL